MAIRDFMSFFETPNYGIPGRFGTNILSIPGFGKLQLSAAGGDGATNNPGTAVLTDSNGWLRIVEGGASSTGVIQSGVIGNLKDWFTLSTASVFSIGCRVRINRTNNYFNVAPMLSFSNPADGANVFNIFTVQELVATIPNFIGSGQNQYLEFTFDGPAGVIHRWIDGVAIAPITITAAIYTLMSAAAGVRIAWTWPRTTSGIGGWVGPDWELKDLVFIEKTNANLADDNRLGPRVVSPVPLGSVDAPWEASEGTPLSVFNTPPGTSLASINTPIVTTDELQTPAIIKLANTPLIGKIDALSITSIAVGAGGSVVSLEPVVKVGDDEQPGMTRALTPAWSYTSKLFLSSTTPAGTPWTAEALAALELSLAPV